jgi:hypothetical protein
VEVVVPARGDEAGDLGHLEETREARSCRPVVELRSLDDALLFFDARRRCVELVVGGRELVLELVHPLLHLPESFFDVVGVRELRSDQCGRHGGREGLPGGSHGDSPPCRGEAFRRPMGAAGDR